MAWVDFLLLEKAAEIALERIGFLENERALAE